MDNINNIIKRYEQLGNSTYQYLIGKYFYEELNDYYSAIKWFYLAAELEHADAQLYLALMYQFGQGVKADTKSAIKWLIKSAKQGHAGSQYNLGVIYENGCGIQKNYIEAYKWYKIASINDYEYANYNYQDIEAKMSKKQKKESIYLAIKWLLNEMLA